jgi:hypothetical protein
MLQKGLFERSCARPPSENPKEGGASGRHRHCPEQSLRSCGMFTRGNTALRNGPTVIVLRLRREHTFPVG